MIYVPDLNYQCIYVYSEGVLRAYERTPQYNQTINYRDYYINSGYIYKDGTTSFGSYSTLPTCLPTNSLTNEVFYRADFDKILVIFMILAIICLYFPLKLFSKLFRRS